MRICIGIEACRKDFYVIVISDEAGNLLAAERRSRHLNYYEQSSEKLGWEIFASVKQVLSKCSVSIEDFENNGSICLGVSGLTTHYDRKEGINSVWKAAGFNQKGIFKVISSGIEIAMLGAIRERYGVALSCHTGSAALARTSKGVFRSGGWGPIFGDEGSGYKIGLRALECICQMADGRKLPEQQLFDAINNHLMQNIKTSKILTQHQKIDPSHPVEGLILIAKEIEKTEFRYIVSDLAKAVFQVWNQSDENKIVDEILKEAAKSLIEQVEAVISSSEAKTEELSFAFHGGVFAFNPQFCDLVQEKMIEKHLKFRNFVKPSDLNYMRPAIGALILAVSEGDLDSINEQTLKLIESQVKNFYALRSDLM
jgi:N-acetylglucosamine kinase-like BadF-type ATPase